MLLEFQLDEKNKIKELVGKIKRIFILDLRYKKFDEKNIEDFVTNNFDLLITDIDTIQPSLLFKNYKQFLRKYSLQESFIEKILIESRKTF